MIFTGYFDESGTHAGAEVSAMAGFVSNARQWRKYEKRTGQLFNRCGVKVFHAIDVRRGHGDFKGWTVDRKIEFLDEFQHIINETLESGVSAFIRNDDYKYYLGLSWPKKTRWDSKYTLMFRACLSQIVDVVGRIPQANEPRLHVVLEDGHNNAEDAVRNYKWVQDRRRVGSLPELASAWTLLASSWELSLPDWLVTSFRSVSAALAILAHRVFAP